jgi:hypothetical protein
MRTMSRGILTVVSILVLLLNLAPASAACLCERSARSEATTGPACCNTDVPPCCATSTGPCPRMQAPLPTHSLTNTCGCESPGASRLQDALIPSIGSHAKQLASADLACVPLLDLGAGVDVPSAGIVRSRTPAPPSATPLYLQNAVLRI